MEALIYIGMILGGGIGLWAKFIRRKPLRAAQYFARTSQEYHDIQRNKRKEPQIRVR